jgi:hypothetical protein
LRPIHPTVPYSVRAIMSGLISLINIEAINYTSEIAMHAIRAGAH